MKTLKNMTGDSLEQMIDYKVVDQDGDSIGTLHSLWSDPTTGAVEFLGVKTGWLFGQNHVVPAEKAELDDTANVVRLPYTSLFVKEAPSISADAEISEAEEENIYRYYGLNEDGAATGTPQVSANLDKVPEAIGASSRASASGRDDGSSNFGAPVAGATSATSGVTRLRRTVRSESAAAPTDATTTAGSLSRTPTAGEAVRGALDSLTPGDSSSTTTTSATAAAPGSFGTSNLYGSTGTTSPVAADATGANLDSSDELKRSTNADPITGEPGSHPVGTGAGALAAGAAGLAIGAVVGGPIGAPLGAAIGGIAGAVSGAFVGKGIAESVNPTEENAFWQSNYDKAPGFEKEYDYNDYSPAYKTGYEGYGRYAASGRDYASSESDLERDYNQNRGASRLSWDKAKTATRAAWDRLQGKK